MADWLSSAGLDIDVGATWVTEGRMSDVMGYLGIYGKPSAPF